MFNIYGARIRLLFSQETGVQVMLRKKQSGIKHCKIIFKFLRHKTYAMDPVEIPIKGI